MWGLLDLCEIPDLDWPMKIVRSWSMKFYDDMKPYSPDSICPKCDFTKIAQDWKGIEFWPNFGLKERTEKIQTAPERIIRTCCNCKYLWAEKPLDAEAQK